MADYRLRGSVVVMRYATKRKVAGLIHNEVIEFFQFISFIQQHLAMGFTQSLTKVSTRGRKIMLLGSKFQPVRRADNLVGICEPIAGSSTSHNPLLNVTDASSYMQHQVETLNFF
jgi:hypothetical protein